MCRGTRVQVVPDEFPCFSRTVDDAGLAHVHQQSRDLATGRQPPASEVSPDFRQPLTHVEDGEVEEAGCHTQVRAAEGARLPRSL